MTKRGVLALGTLLSLLMIGPDADAQQRPKKADPAPKLAGSFQSESSRVRISVRGRDIAGVLIRLKDETRERVRVFTARLSDSSPGTAKGTIQGPTESTPVTLRIAPSGELLLTFKGMTERLSRLGGLELAGIWVRTGETLKLSRGETGELAGRLTRRGAVARLTLDQESPRQASGQWRSDATSSPCRLTLADERLTLERGEEKTTFVRADLEDGLLSSHQRWNRATPAEQDAVIRHVDRTLGDAFKHVSTETWTCGDHRFRIATCRESRLKLELRLIPGGVFGMGSILGSPREQPLHVVQIKPLLVGSCEVTQALWDRVGGADERERKDPTLPITGVSHRAVRDWLKKAGAGLRLPSEAEWEFACRAGSSDDYAFGESVKELEKYTRIFDLNRPITSDDELAARPVRERRPNAFGLFDMHGNVEEWCLDHWWDSYRSAPRDGTARSGRGADAHRVVRGGCWADGPKNLRCAWRNAMAPGFRSRCLGFRVVRSLDD